MVKDKIAGWLTSSRRSAVGLIGLRQTSRGGGDTKRSALLTVAAASVLVPCAFATAQECEPQWSDAFVDGGVHSSRDNVHALQVFDDGSGSTLFIAGDWTLGFGGVLYGWAGAFDGDKWIAATDGLDDVVNAFATFDDDTGPALYAGGRFTGGVRRLTQEGWEELGPGGPDETFALVVFDDGTGNAIWTGTHKWDGQQWTTIPPNPRDRMAELVVLDEGSGEVLYAASFGRGDVFRFEGGRWVEVNPLQGLDQVRALAVFDDGTGQALYAGGRFRGNAGGVILDHIAKLVNGRWVPVGAGLEDAVEDLVTWQSHSRLVAVGQGSAATGRKGWVASSYAYPVEITEETFSQRVLSVTLGDIGEGERVFIGGGFENTLTQSALGYLRPFQRLAQWDGSTLLPLGSGLSGRVAVLGRERSIVPAMAFQWFDDGTGPAMYVGGAVSFVGQTRVDGIVRWDGSNWTTVGGGLGDVSWVWDLEVVNDRGVDTLYASGAFHVGGGGLPRSRVAKLSGGEWQDLFEVESVLPMLYVRDGPLKGLYAGGSFQSIGGVAANRIAVFDPTTETWSPLGSGVASGIVLDIAFYDDGSGPAIYAAGSFDSAGGFPSTGLAKWDGVNWQGLNIPGVQKLEDLEVFDVGAGPQLFFAGSSNGVLDGSGITVLFTPFSGDHVAAGFDDGNGPAVYFGGHGLTSTLAKWDGQTYADVLPAPAGGRIVALQAVEFDSRNL